MKVQLVYKNITTFLPVYLGYLYNDGHIYCSFFSCIEPENSEIALPMTTIPNTDVDNNNNNNTNDSIDPLNTDSLFPLSFNNNNNLNEIEYSEGNNTVENALNILTDKEQFKDFGIDNISP